MISPKGQVAIVTGGAMGIGEAIVRELANAGAAVAIADVNLEAAQKLAGEVTASGCKAVAFKHDVTNWDSAGRLVAEVEKALGPINILVNNAGVSKRAPILEMTESEWDRIMDINAKGQFITLRAVLPGHCHDPLA